MKFTKQEFLKKIMLRREAENYLGLTQAAMQYHISNGNIVPCKEYGTGKGKVQLFWQDDLDVLKRDYMRA